jgi:RNA polymerase sigma-70 factor, ECF subfamily
LRPYLARRVASSVDIDDLLQDIFVRMQQGLASLRNEERFGAWVYRIANSVLVDRARQRARAPLLAAENAEGPSAFTEPTDALDERVQSDLTECVALFVSRLPSAYRDALTLTELEGLTQKEASEMLGMSLSGLKSRVQRGRDKIRHMFEECCRISVDSRGHVIGCEPRKIAQVSPGCRDAAVAWASARGKPSSS